MTPQVLRRRENAIFEALLTSPTGKSFRGRLYRDGVPTPAAYLRQRVRVLFVFREPNMSARPHELDMRDEVSNEYFRPIGQDGSRQLRTTKCWWNAKAGLFAHAVSAAIEGETSAAAFRRFKKGEWNHEVVNRHAYVQVKKVGGAGRAITEEIKAHAQLHADTLQRQVRLYRPHLVLGCGVGPASPAKLFAEHVIPGGDQRETTGSGATWWQYPDGHFPRALVQLWHPAWRGNRVVLCRDVWDSVREVVAKSGLGTRSRRL